MAKQHASQFIAIAQKSKNRVNECTVAEVKQRSDSQQPFYLIDVREDHEWNNGRLPKAIHLGKGIIERDIEKTIPESNAEIVLYCGGGYRSAMSADALQQMGYTNVVSMDGGFSGWRAAGYPIETND